MSVGVLSAFAASLCCITPVLAFFSGASGLASTFSWMEPARPWLIALSIGLLGFAWYQKLKPRTVDEIRCDCDDERKPTLLQSRRFLGIVTVLTALMITFPWYGSMLYPENRTNTGIVSTDQVTSVAYRIEGMTCASCEKHIAHGVSEVEGVIDVTTDYRTATVVVRFDRGRTSDTAIHEAIDATGYHVTDKEEMQ